MTSSACLLRCRISAIAKFRYLCRASTTKNVTSVCLRGMQTQAHEVPMSHREEFLRAVANNESLRNTMGYSLSFATPSSGNVLDDFDLSSEIFVDPPNERMQRQLNISEDQLRESCWDNKPLPHTLEEALRPSDRAIVVTETEVPFKIVDVNTAWEGLCGYSFVECQGKTLGSLLGGPETDRSAVTAVVSQLLRGEEAGAVLTNYTKEGRKFRNHLRVGPLMDDDNHVTHFVGILQEIHDDQQASSSMLM